MSRAREARGPLGPFVERLVREGEPSVRYALALAGLGAASLRALAGLRRELRASPRVKALLSERDADGRIARHPYSKWTGPHWVLVTLAELRYPPGDRTLLPLAEQVLAWLFDPRRLDGRRAPYEPYLAPLFTVRGRVRIHASLEGNALYALLALGLADERVDALAARLVETQWPDGGWNCDRAPGASHSSFEETLAPLRGLFWHARLRKSRASARAARAAAEHLLERRLSRRRSTGARIAADFVALHFPCYWHYDVLQALRVLAEGGLLSDPRCDDALALLEAKRRPDGGFPAESKFWAGPASTSRRTLVPWPPVGARRSNPFVTAEALLVLAEAGRLSG